ncbi:MAG: DUF1648 domain-containing protein [Dehalococcoidales bacterium]
MKETNPGTGFAFHWSYIGLPVAILLLTLILTAFFYPRLPAEVAYRFQPDGSPDNWLGRDTIVLWTLLPQFLLTLVAGGTAGGITILTARFIQPESTWTNPGRITSLMGNMVALPQSILLFAMLDIFSYNSYRIHLLPLWVFALIVLVVGGIILGIFFFQAVRQFWITSKE